VSFSEASRICIRNDSELANVSLSASLVSFERRNSSCIVIRARILASCTNISKWKRASSPRPKVFFNTRSNQTSFYFSFLGIGAEARTGTSPDVVGRYVSSVAFCTISWMISQTEYLLLEVQRPMLPKHASHLQSH